MFNFEPNPITARRIVMSIQPYNEDKITISADDDLINVVLREHHTIKGMLKRTRDHIVSDFEMAYERRKKYIPERLEDNNPLRKFFDDSFPHLGMDDIHDITIELVLNPSGVMDAYSSIGLILPTNFEEVYKVRSMISRMVSYVILYSMKLESSISMKMREHSIRILRREILSTSIVNSILFTDFSRKHMETVEVMRLILA